MAKIKLMLTNLSGRDLSRSGYSGTGKWSPAPPASLANGLVYGPIYLMTGTLFHVEVGYKLNQDLNIGVGNENFDIELRADPQAAAVEVVPRAIPAGYGVAFSTDKTPEGFEVSLTYQGSNRRSE